MDFRYDMRWEYKLREGVTEYQRINIHQIGILTRYEPQACKFCTLDKSVDPKTHAVEELEESMRKRDFSKEV